MSAYRLAPAPAPMVGKLTGPVKSRDYLAWIHELPCIVTGRSPVEAAHVSYAAPLYGAPGRGMQRKVSDRWALPLHPVQHAAQHAHGNEREWWAGHGIDPHLVALVLWGVWNERKDDATEVALTLIKLGLGRTG